MEKDNVTLVPDYPIRVAVDLRPGNVPLANKTVNGTLHNTGNSSSARGEDEYFDGGAEGRGVNVHFIVDEKEAVQRMHLWARGVHAGNAEGNATGLAIEMTEFRNPWSDIEDNTVKTMVALHIRDPRLDWSGAEGYVYNVDNWRGHGQWPGANPGCPGRLIQVYGNIPNAIAKMEARAMQMVHDLKLEPNPPSKVKPHPVGHEDTKDGKSFIDADGNEWIWFNKKITPTSAVQTYEWANVDSRKGAILPANKAVTIYWLVAAQAPALDDSSQTAPEIWGTTRLGWRVLIRDLI